ncbi:GNAT family N-acetyltransferase [Mesorhizobium sp. SB112]|uniref:GNAT family N-acetyltransferase n=1 Tax=Mesorhizobium sp. SB112 TaxID=3151853 RepID=UPI003262FF38
MAERQIAFEAMTPDHLEAAVSLSRQAGWPHRREDWEMVLSVSQGIVALDEGRVVATIMMTPYGADFATINMVIVDAAMRGRGLGRKIMERAILEAGARICLLVATQEGLPLYEKLGFVATGEIAQHQGEAVKVDLPGNVSWAEAGDFDRLAAMDRAAIGMDRSVLMQKLSAFAKFAVIREKGEVEAFAAIREFGRGLVVGPVVARNADEAKALIDFMLAHNQGKFVRVDTEISSALGGWLVERGLVHVGGGIAMRRAPSSQEITKTAPWRTYALVNQALG